MPNVARFAKALYALHTVGCLADAACKPAVGMLIRQATETPLFHLTTNFRSRAAERAMAGQIFRSPPEYHRWCRKHLRHEHMVPTSVVRQILIATPNLSEESIAKVLRTYGHRATITRAEDTVLGAMGLAKKMPDRFWTSGSDLYNDVRARYIEAKLFDQLVPSAGETWY